MPGDFLLVEVILLAVLGPELGAVASDQRAANEIEIISNLHRLPENLLNCLGIITPEIGDGIVIRMKITQKPHHLNVSFALFFKIPGGPDLVHVAIDEQLEKVTRMIGWSPIFAMIYLKTVTI